MQDQYVHERHEHCCIETPFLSIQQGEWGFHAKSRKAIPEGTVITRNDATSHSLLSKFVQDYCAHCFTTAAAAAQQPKKLFKCSACQFVRYCGRDCQRNDYRQHKMECLLYQQDSSERKQPDDDDQVRLLLRTISSLTPRKKSKKDHQSCTCSSETDGYGVPKSISCASNHWDLMAQAPTHLMGESTPNNNDTTSALVLKFTQQQHQHTTTTTNDIDKMLRIFQANNFGIFNALHETIGQGVYPHAAILNHSCDPNCLIRFVNVGGTTPLLEIVTLRHVSANEELTHSYVDLVLNTQERQAHLERLHGFRCGCLRCQDKLTVQLPATLEPTPNLIYDWVIQHYCPFRSEIQNDERDKYKGCDMMKIPMDQVGKVLGTTNATMNDEQLSATVKSIHQQATMYFHNDDPDSELDCLKRAVNLLEGQNVPPLSRSLYEARASLLSALLLADGSNNVNHKEEAIRHCFAMVAFLLVSLPPNHPLLGLQLYTLGDLLAQQQADDTHEERIYYKWARKVLKISHGPQHPLVAQLPV